MLPESERENLLSLVSAREPSDKKVLLPNERIEVEEKKREVMLMFMEGAKDALQAIAVR
jgi:hypothetical protein